MKRYIKSNESKGMQIYNNILEAVTKLTDPQKFHTSRISLKGVYGREITVAISHGLDSYVSKLELGDGARYVAEAEDFEGAKQLFEDLARKYVRYAFKWQGRKLTDSEYRDLTNGL